jgi:hypothetical protein
MGEWPRLGGDGEEREWEFVRACLLFPLVSALIFPPALAGWRRRDGGGGGGCRTGRALGKEEKRRSRETEGAVLGKEIAVD